jgi:hypothetical protein
MNIIKKDKAEKAQAFAAAATASKQDDSSSYEKFYGLLEIISKRQEKPEK